MRHFLPAVITTELTNVKTIVKTHAAIEPFPKLWELPPASSREEALGSKNERLTGLVRKVRRLSEAVQRERLSAAGCARIFDWSEMEKCLAE